MNTNRKMLNKMDTNKIKEKLEVLFILRTLLHITVKF